MFRHFALAHDIADPFQEVDHYILAGFVVWAVASLGYAANMARRWLTGVRSFFVDAGLPTEVFEHPFLLRVVLGLRRIAPPKKARTKLPITTQIFEKMVALAKKSDFSFMAAVCVGVYGLFRASEIVFKPHSPSLLLRRADVSISADYAEIRLRNSKSNLLRVGATVPFFTNGSSSYIG